MTTSPSMYRTFPDPSTYLFLQRRAAMKEQPTTGTTTLKMSNPPTFKFTVEPRSPDIVILPPFKNWPIDRDRVFEEYNRSSSIHPWPIVESLSVNYGGRLGLSAWVTGVITCFNKIDYQQVQKAFCVPGTIIKDLKIQKPIWPSYDMVFTKGEISKLLIATYSMNYDSNRRAWTVTWTAIAPSQHLKFLPTDTINKKVQGPAAIDGTGTNPALARPRLDSRSIIDTIKLDAALVGNSSKDASLTTTVPYKTDAKQRMTIIPRASLNGFMRNPAHIDQFSSETQPLHELSSAVLIVQNDEFNTYKGPNFDPTTTSESSTIYVTLAYLVERIVNQKLIPAAGQFKKSKMTDLRLNIDPTLSKCYLPSGHIGSGDPRKIIINGFTTNKVGNYKDAVGSGVDFNTPILFGPGGGPIACKPATPPADYRNCNPGAIYISLDVIQAALQLEGQLPSNGSTTDIHFKAKTQAVDLYTFFTNIFQEINRCTGGAIALQIVDHPDDKFNNHLLIVDQADGQLALTGIPCIVFDPIDGDGSTISCNISTSAGSNTYQAAMFANALNGGDLLLEHSPLEKSETLAQRDVDKAQTIAEINSYLLGAEGASIASDKFSASATDKMIGLLARLVQAMKPTQTGPDNAKLPKFPGVELTIELDGVYGFFFGNAISATSLPQEYIPKGGPSNYFLVTGVEHQITATQWITKLTAILSWASNVVPLKLEG